MKVFIDTSAFCALTVPKDQFNSTAKIIYKQIQDKKSYIYSSDYVLMKSIHSLKQEVIMLCLLDLWKKYKKAILLFSVLQKILRKQQKLSLDNYQIKD